MKHELSKMTLIGRSRKAFKNHLVRKSYWVNHYECPVCKRTAAAMNNIVAHKKVMCNGEKTFHQQREA